MEKQIFRLVVLEEARDFLTSLPSDVGEKIAYNIRKVKNGIKDSELFKKLDNSNIWEFRTLYKGNSYRLFAFWDRDLDAFVVATHGIIKKTQKTPAKEILKAEKIRQAYFENKNKRNISPVLAPLHL